MELIWSNNNEAKSKVLPGIRYNVDKMEDVVVLKEEGNKHLIGTFTVHNNNGFFKFNNYFQLSLKASYETKTIGFYLSKDDAKKVALSIENSIKETISKTHRIFITEIETQTEYWGEGQRDCIIGRVGAA